MKYLKQPALSVEEFEREAITFYPNPVTNMLTFQTTFIIESIDVYDVLGRTIQTYIPVNNQVDLSPLETGQYFIKARTADQIFNIKILKN